MIGVVARTLALASALTVAGCQSITELVVRVDSDLAPGDEFETAKAARVSFRWVRFKLEMLPFGEPIDQPEPEPLFREAVQLRTADTPDGALLPVELGVVARGDWKGRVLGVEVRGQASEGDPALDTELPYLYARGQALFVDGEVALFSLRLLSACSVDAAADPACSAKDQKRCVVTAGSAGCEAIPLDEAPPAYTAPMSVTR